MPPGNVAFLLALPVLMEERGKIWSTWAKVVSVDLICKTFWSSLFAHLQPPGRLLLAGSLHKMRPVRGGDGDRKGVAGHVVRACHLHHLVHVDACLQELGMSANRRPTCAGRASALQQRAFALLAIGMLTR